MFDRRQKRGARVYLTGRLFYAFLLYTLFTWACEAEDLFCYFTGLPQVTVVSRIAALVAVYGFHRLVGSRAGSSSTDSACRIGCTTCSGLPWAFAWEPYSAACPWWWYTPRFLSF